MKNLMLLTLLGLSAAAQAQLPTQAVVTQYPGVAEVASVLGGPSGRVLVGDSSLSMIFKYSAQGDLMSTFAPAPATSLMSASVASAPGALVPASGFSPAGMDLDAQGRMVVANSDGNRLEVFNADGTLAGEIGVETAAQALVPETIDSAMVAPYLAEPQAVAYGPQGRLYVADAAHNRVAVFDSSTGAYLFAWGRMGYSGDYGMSYPMGIAVTNGKVYVADAGNARVLVYDTEGHFIRQVGSRGLGSGQFDSPFGLGVDGEGRLWVADNGAQKVVVFGADGQVQKEYGQNVDGLYFEDLSGIYVSPSGKVLAADGTGSRVYSWDTGVTLARYDGKVAAPLQGHLSDALLAFGPVPARAGQTLNLKVPFEAQELRWELYSADMRRVAEGSVAHRDTAQIVQTADLGSGVYMIRMRVSDGIDSREAIQKIVITR